MTNSYNPDQKRGGPANAGNWTKYENSDPEGALPQDAAPAVGPALDQDAVDHDDIKEALEANSNDAEWSALVAAAEGLGVSWTFPDDEDTTYPGHTRAGISDELRTSIKDALEGDSDDAVHDALVDVADTFSVEYDADLDDDDDEEE